MALTLLVAKSMIVGWSLFLDTATLYPSRVANGREVSMSDLPLYIHWPVKTALYDEFLKSGL